MSKLTLFTNISRLRFYQYVHQQIVKHDIKPNTQDEKGQTLLFHLLSNADSTIIMLYLHNFDHDLSITDESGETAYFMLHCLIYNSTSDRPWRSSMIQGRVHHTTTDLLRMIAYLLSFDKDGSLLLKRNKRGNTALDNIDLYRDWVQKQFKEKHWENRLKEIIDHVPYATVPISRHIVHKCTLFQFMYINIDHYESL